MNSIFFALTMNLISAVIMWTIIILSNGWYVRKQIRKSFAEERLDKFAKSPEGGSIWNQEAV
jgi:hypothetical protein